MTQYFTLVNAMLSYYFLSGNSNFLVSCRQCEVARQDFRKLLLTGKIILRLAPDPPGSVSETEHRECLILLRCSDCVYLIIFCDFWAFEYFVCLNVKSLIFLTLLCCRLCTGYFILTWLYVICFPAWLKWRSASRTLLKCTAGGTMSTV